MVLATGGYVAVPVGVAARWVRRPLVVHEQTVRLGLANRQLARFATAFAVSSESTLDLVPDSVRRKATVTGNPVRGQVLSGDADRGAVAFGPGLDHGLPTVYVTGGAQGATQVNELVRDSLPSLLERANVFHQCGAANVAEYERVAAELPPRLAARYRVAGYVGAELPDVLALADVVIARSGAGTVAELTALGKASVLVPLATAAGNEQVHNARHLETAGAAVALVGEATAADLRDAVLPLLEDPEYRAEMAKRARGLGRPDAAQRLVDLITAVADS
ncbi:UDP-N-acetylglucosamine--N-acetylmuramyl-(pentapeptide) pyrophosphoryl-undecaprenol N-acetylglucosamine transferase [Amycolatopsis sp. CA-230715]|nr:UDP-N-acetylglucosamine--N-acetylmuramyl-(pentapeptide) pyrophosphoryl-undecaprenol N-acetylglucosamine transferase [Amycolatopsis sp. CA-230715]